MSDEMDIEQRIRERAYQIWIDEGQPHGRHDEHWRQARAELATGARSLLPELKDCGEGQAPVETQSVDDGVNPDELRR